MSSEKTARSCLYCGEEFSESQSFPFCSGRCKMADLQGWLDESYRIPLKDEEQEDESVLNAQQEH